MAAGAGAGAGMDPSAFDPSKFAAGGAGWDDMTKAAQSMMKDFLQPEKIKELAENPEVLEIQKDPKMQEIIKDVQTNGPMAVLKYYSDPDAMQIFSKITSLLGLPADFASASADFAKLGGMPGMPGAPGAGAPDAAAGAGGAAQDASKQDAHGLE